MLFVKICKMCIAHNRLSSDSANRIVRKKAKLMALFSEQCITQRPVSQRPRG